MQIIPQQLQTMVSDSGYPAGHKPGLVSPDTTPTPR